MAYGMLTSALLGAGTGLVKFGMDKVSRSMEEEAKLKADAEREARIEEAAIRSEGRKNERSDFEFDRLQSQKAIDSATEREAKFEDERRKLREANDPNTLTGQKNTIEIANLKKTGMLTEQNIAEKQIDIEQKQRVIDLQNQLSTATTPEQKAIITDQITALSGKNTNELKTLSKVVSVDNGKSHYEVQGVYDPRTKQQIWANNITPVDPKEMENKAVAYANLKAGTSFTRATEAEAFASKGWGDTKEKNAETSTNFSKAYNEFKLNGGVTVELDKTKTSLSPAPFKADDPARQKEYDIIFGGVVKQHESGNKGVNAQNPTSTAGGTWQLTYPTAEFYKAKKDANGKISNVEKDRVAPEFYKDVYRNTNGDPAAMIASGFAPNDVKSAMKDAVKKGTKWWQETDSITPKDMEESYVRARESVARLQSVGIEPDARLLDFVDNYKATKIASATPDKSAFKLKAVRPAL
jgi:hypothetical protein